MYRRLVLGSATTLGASLWLGACAGPLATTFTTPTPRPAADVYACVQQQVKSIGYTTESHDDQELRVVARKYDELTRRPDVRFRRLIDRLSIDVDPGQGDNATLSVEAHTFADLETHRGPTEQEEKPSDTAKLAAQAILNRCAAKP